MQIKQTIYNKIFSRLYCPLRYTNNLFLSSNIIDLWSVNNLANRIKDHLINNLRSNRIKGHIAYKERLPKKI